MAPNVCKKHVKTLFLEVKPEKGLYYLCGRKFIGEIRTKNFSGKFGKIRAKILRTPKILPAPAPVVQKKMSSTKNG